MPREGEAKSNERKYKEPERGKRNFDSSWESFVSFSFASQGIAETSVPQDKRKQTVIGKYVTARQAYEMWKADPDRVRILDCRTREEYLNVGHPTMAYSIPAHVRTRRRLPAGQPRVRGQGSAALRTRGCHPGDLPRRLPKRRGGQPPGQGEIPECVQHRGRIRGQKRRRGGGIRLEKIRRAMDLRRKSQVAVRC